MAKKGQAASGNDDVQKTRKKQKTPSTKKQQEKPRKRSSVHLDEDRGQNAPDDVHAAEKHNLDDGIGEVPFSQSYARARETMDGGKNLGKKISDLDLVEEHELRAALSKVPVKHEKEQAALMDKYKLLYPKWHFQLRCGFGLLMYGFGSKKALLEDFAASTLLDGAVIVVNGYLPSVNVKSVVFMVVEALWEQRRCKKTGSKSGERLASTHSLDELFMFLNEKEDNIYVYVVVHNIDGPSLRDSDAQQMFANLAACHQIRFVASVDHINASLLWDKSMSNTKFNWCWHNTPTYVPYTVEAMHLPLILVSAGAAKSARSALLVLQSLTPNAQSVFRTLAEYQLSHPEELGLSVHKLYTHCRERFLVSSELTLRSHLTEFKDHELVRSRRGLDGQDCLFVPLPCDALTKLLEQIG